MSHAIWVAEEQGKKKGSVCHECPRIGTNILQVYQCRKIYNIGSLVFGGDITEKMLIPILDLGNNQYRAKNRKQHADILWREPA